MNEIFPSFDSSLLKAFQKDNRIYEEVVSKIISLLPFRGVMVDCGAHAGDHTRAMLARQGDNRVYAIEAIPRLASSIGIRFSDSKKLIIRQVALGKCQGYTRFSVASNMLGLSGIVKREELPNVTWEFIDVPLQRLDDMLAEPDVGSVALIKLDLEGGEFDALIGSSKIIRSSCPLIVFENSLRRASLDYGYAWKDFSDFFCDHGYEVTDFFGNVVNEDYWNSTLQTYMFIATRIGSGASNWLRQVLPDLVRTCAKM